MIKLIASDLDGTILLNGAQAVDESLFEVIRSLNDKGIIFVAASGRQAESLHKLFAPVENDIMYISENGALVKYKGRIVSKTTMEKKLALEIAKDIYAKENCEVLISGEKTAYIMPKTEKYLHRMRHIIKYDTTIINSLSDIEEEILKVSVCDLTGIHHSSEYFIKQWSRRADVAVSGDLYLDFTAIGVSKGKAMGDIQESMGITPEECMAFGDNYNDIEMLKSVKYAYVMEMAAEEIKNYAHKITPWVEGTLRELFLK